MKKIRTIKKNKGKTIIGLFVSRSIAIKKLLNLLDYFFTLYSNLINFL